MGYFPNYINHQCNRPAHVKLGNMQKGENCTSLFGVVHKWKLGQGCRGCPYFTDQYENEELNEDGDEDSC